MLGGVVTAANHQICRDGGKPIVGSDLATNIPCCILPKPGGHMPGAPDMHIDNVNAYRGRQKEWLRPLHGVATAYLANDVGWRRTIEAICDPAERQRWIGAAMRIQVCY